MNKERRKQISEIITELQNLTDLIAGVEDDEQDYFDNMPENFQDGEKGEQAERVLDLLIDAKGGLEEAMGSLEEATE